MEVNSKALALQRIGPAVCHTVKELHTIVTNRPPSSRRGGACPSRKHNQHRFGIAFHSHAQERHRLTQKSTGIARRWHRHS